jgi:hypothetical protein
MSPLYDARLPDGQPQIHAIVIGVSSYPHLPRGSHFREAPAPKTFALDQLTSPAISAAAVTDWLLEEHHNPSTPLGSVELVLSPESYAPSRKAAIKLGVNAGAQLRVTAATLSEIKQAAGRWYLRTNKHRDNIALFYFCGHGLEASDRYLLPADYGSNPLDWTEHIINFTATYNNLDRCRAKTQCFFLDACRDRPDELRDQAARAPLGQALVGPQSGSRLDRDLSIYHAAAPGRSAAGPPAQKSYFTQALLECLSGLGARDASGDTAPVDLVSLSSAMREFMDRLAEESKLPLRCNIMNDMLLPTPADLHVAGMPVKVLTVIACEPQTAHAVAKLTLQDSSGQQIVRTEVDVKPWRLTIPVGKYVVGASFDPAHPYANYTQPVLAVPPVFKPKVSILARTDLGGEQP